MSKTFLFHITKILTANYKGYLLRIKEISKKSGRSVPLIVLDTLYCGLRYGAALSDYTDMEFYKKNHKQRASFVTVTVNNKFIRAMNDPSYRHLFDSKSNFYRHFESFLGRRYLLLNEASQKDFADFIKDKEYIFVKPDNMSSGIGVNRISKDSFHNPSDLMKILKEQGSAIAEEGIIQHRELNRLNDSCVNTVRIITITTDNSCDIVGAILKVGNGAVVDNMGAGGLSAPLDIETGCVNKDASVRKGERHTVHPSTGVVFKGFCIPFWQEVLEMARKASVVVPQVRFVGWDIAVTPEGPVLVEGNYYPGNGLWQIPDGIGKMHIVQKYLKKSASG